MLHQVCPVKNVGSCRKPLSRAGFQGFWGGVDLNEKRLVCDFPEMSLISEDGHVLLFFTIS